MGGRHLFKQDTDESQFIDKVVHISRVAKVVKGGRRFSFSAVVDVGDGQGNVGWGLGILGIAEYFLGEFAQARSCLSAALRAAAEHRIRLMLQYALTGSALILADAGETQRAVEIHTLAVSQLSHVANSRWFEDVIEPLIAAAAATLSPDVVAAAQERGRALDLWDTAEELLDELRG